MKNWDEYTKSVARLAEFVQTHEVSAVLGAHIEMTNTPGEAYPVGTIYQPTAGCAGEGSADRGTGAHGRETDDAD